jgi:hypothetical protein
MIGKEGEEGEQEDEREKLRRRWQGSERVRGQAGDRKSSNGERRGGKCSCRGLKE